LKHFRVNHNYILVLAQDRYLKGGFLGRLKDQQQFGLGLAQDQLTFARCFLLTTIVGRGGHR
jgi:hypothetical protein